MSDSASKFQKALAARNAQRAEEAARKAGGGNFSNYPELPWTALAIDQEKVIRLRGGPVVEERLPTDCKQVFSTYILGDDDKSFRVIAPNPKERKDWILHKISKLVLSYDWDPDSVGENGRKGVRHYHYAKTNPDIFNRVAKNNKPDNKFEKGWAFTESVVWNVIDRSAYDWHKENKKCRLLSKKAGAPNKDGKVWFDLGVPMTVYNSILDDILCTDGNTDWETYDIVIRKLAADPWYKVYHGLDDTKRISEASRALVKAGALTEEEKSWELFDLDKLFQITSYKRIKSNLGIFIQQVDKVFGKHFYDELSELVELEERDKAEKAAKEKPAERPTLAKSAPSAAQPAEKVPTQPAASVNYPGEDIDEVPTEEPTLVPEEPVKARPSFAPVKAAGVTNPNSRMTAEKWKGLEDGTLTGNVYKGVSLMTAEEKALVIDVDMNTGMFIWDERAGELYEGASSKFPSPGCVHVDPWDGSIFPESSVAPMPSLN